MLRYRGWTHITTHSCTVCLHRLVFDLRSSYTSEEHTKTTPGSGISGAGCSMLHIDFT